MRQPEKLKKLMNLRMKKATSFSLFSNYFNPQRFSKAAPFLSRIYISNNVSSSSSSPFSSSPIHPTGPHLQSSAKTHGLIFKLHPFQTNPCQNLCTLAEKPTHLSSTQREQKEKDDLLREAFESAQTSEEMLSAFEDMETEGCFDEWEMGMNALCVALKISREDPEKTLSFAERGLKVLDEDQDGKPSAFAIMALQLMASASRSLEKFNESEIYFNRARRLLDRWEEVGCHSFGIEVTEEFLFQVKKSLEINEISLMKAFDVAEKLMASGKYEEAFDTLEGIVQYTEDDCPIRAKLFTYMGKALCHQKKYADAKRYLEISCAIIEKQETVVLGPNGVSQEYSKISKAFESLNEFEIAGAVHMEYSMISKVYESMNEFEIAISFLKRTVPLLEKEPQENKSNLGCVFARIGYLLVLIGEDQQAIPYLESAEEILKESIGPSHPMLGFKIYYSLGVAYMNLNRPESAPEMFAVAKDIIDVSLDPHCAASIEACCRKLSNVYRSMGSYTIAIEIQQRVINALESHGPSSEDELREAQRVLENLKTKALMLAQSKEQPRLA